MHCICLTSRDRTSEERSDMSPADFAVAVTDCYALLHHVVCGNMLLLADPCLSLSRGTTGSLSPRPKPKRGSTVHVLGSSLVSILPILLECICQWRHTEVLSVRDLAQKAHVWGATQLVRPLLG